jgi:outer membrane murein-binding lipoprotein Lpp
LTELQTTDFLWSAVCFQQQSNKQCNDVVRSLETTLRSTINELSTSLKDLWSKAEALEEKVDALIAAISNNAEDDKNNNNAATTLTVSTIKVCPTTTNGTKKPAGRLSFIPFFPFLWNRTLSRWHWKSINRSKIR